jgi:hypothetical protein
VLGTAILVDDKTRESAGAGFCFRPLGKLALAGKSATVIAHELMGPHHRTNDRDAAYVGCFASAIAHFQRCEWDQCLAALAQCRRYRSHDPAAEHYFRAASAMAQFPGIENRTGALPIDSR